MEGGSGAPLEQTRLARATVASRQPFTLCPAVLVLPVLAVPEYRPVSLQQLLGLSPGKTQHPLPTPGHSQGWLELHDHRLKPALYNAFVKQLLKTSKNRASAR